ncbi:hypothetical protein [Fimbriiglobus ruber]|uniref:hypothetical protein n=1 Tax=Fimbriiglobus ruber TaxID=1908690 RepID=UPI000B4BB55C|nr:hypothetical protein [Fimbriiglobus ruber]
MGVVAAAAGAGGSTVIPLDVSIVTCVSGVLSGAVPEGIEIWIVHDGGTVAGTAVTTEVPSDVIVTSVPAGALTTVPELKLIGDPTEVTVVGVSGPRFVN